MTRALLTRSIPHNYPRSTAVTHLCVGRTNYSHIWAVPHPRRRCRTEIREIRGRSIRMNSSRTNKE